MSETQKCLGRGIWEFLLREWLLVAALAALALSSWTLHAWPSFEPRQLRAVFVLWILFTVVSGIEGSGILDAIARAMERGRWLAPRMVTLGFALSMFLTIDATLVTLLPLLLRMRIRRKIPLTILVALSTHLGAALTPFGTPQNLFIFAWYGPSVREFLRVMAPFSFGLFALFFALSWLMDTRQSQLRELPTPSVERVRAWVYTLFFLLAVGTVLGFVPLGAAAVVLLYAFVVDPEALRRVDYTLLLTFVAFIGLTSNLREIIDGTLSHIGHTYLLSAGMSQLISNVPTTLILERFTAHWRSLLWGVNAGSFGTPIAALANLITLRLYARYAPASSQGRFLLAFTFAGVVVLLLATLLHQFCFDFIHFYPEAS